MMTTDTAGARTELARWFTRSGRARHIGHFTFKRDVRDSQRAVQLFRCYVQTLANVGSLFGRSLSYLAFAERHGPENAGDHVIDSDKYHVHALLGRTGGTHARRLREAWEHGHCQVSPYDGNPAGANYVVKSFGRVECGWDVQLPDDHPLTETLGVA